MFHLGLSYALIVETSVFEIDMCWYQYVLETMYTRSYIPASFRPRWIHFAR